MIFSHCAEESPEKGTIIVDTEGLQKQRDTESKKDSDSISRHIGVAHLKNKNGSGPEEMTGTDLVYLHEHENSNEVHEGGVELEGDLGRADMVRT